MMELAGIHVCGVGWDESEEMLYSQAPSRPEARTHRYGWTDEPDPGGRPERVLDGGRPRSVSDWILTSRLSISRCSRCTFQIASTPVSGQLNRFTCVFFTCFIDRLSFWLPVYLIPTSRPNARRVRTVRKESRANSLSARVGGHTLWKSSAALSRSMENECDVIQSPPRRDWLRTERRARTYQLVSGGWPDLGRGGRGSRKVSD